MDSTRTCSFFRALLAIGLVLPLFGCLTPDERSPSVLPAATVRNLMVGKTIPASKVVFEVANEAPKDAAGWQAVVANAQVLVEAGERLQVGARGPGKDDWIRYSRAMGAAAGQVFEAAEKQDADAVASAGNTVFEACEGCHRIFMKKEEGAARAASS